MAFLKKRSIKKTEEEVVSPAEHTATSLHEQLPKGTGGVLLHPHFTEKTAAGAVRHTYTFVVAKQVNKIEIARAVGNHYDVTVERVHIINIPKKQRMRGRQIGFKPGIKKAIVTIADGQTIEIQ